MPSDITGSAAGITARQAVVAAFPVDGDALSAASVRTGLQTLSDHLKFLQDTAGLLGTASTWTALQTFSAGITVAGTATLGGTAITGASTLAGKLTITGPASDEGLVVNAGAGATRAIYGYANGSGIGVEGNGNTTGTGVKATGGSTSGAGLYAQGFGGEGVVAVSNTNHAAVLTGNATKAALRLVPHGSAPSTAAVGDIYFDSGLDKLMVYRTSGWAQITTS